MLTEDKVTRVREQDPAGTANDDLSSSPAEKTSDPSGCAVRNSAAFNESPPRQVSG